MDREIFVYIDLRGVSVLVGRLWTRVRRGRESASFEYDASWLDHPERFALEPALTLGPGPFHTLPEKALFGAIGDSAPDQWGRVLMRRAERRRVEKEGQPPRTCSGLRTSAVVLENIADFGSDCLRMKLPLGSHYLRMSAH